MHTPDAARFEIVDLFAGPGGLDSAARELGVRTVGLEFDANACRTRESEGLRTDSCDVRDRGPVDYPDANVLAGGPPCQTFTVAGAGAGRKALDQVLAFARRFQEREPLESIRTALKELSDERTGLVLEPLRWILAAKDQGRPYAAVILEQVPAVLPVWEDFAEILAKERYLVAAPKVLHAEEYGVPQTRRRAFLIARYEDSFWSDEAPVIPEPTHRRYRKGISRAAGDSRLLPWVTMGEALKRTRREKFEIVSNYGTGGDPKLRGRRSSEEPSATVTGKVSRNRVISISGRERLRLTLDEAGLLQSFPSGYRWSGNDISQQIGNAVPPRLGMHVIAAALGLSDALKTAIHERDNAQYQ